MLGAELNKISNGVLLGSATVFSTSQPQPSTTLVAARSVVGAPSAPPERTDSTSQELLDFEAVQRGATARDCRRTGFRGLFTFFDKYFGAPSKIVGTAPFARPALLVPDMSTRPSTSALQVLRMKCGAKCRSQTRSFFWSTLSLRGIARLHASSPASSFGGLKSEYFVSHDL